MSRTVPVELPAANRLKPPALHRIALLFNGNKIFDREVLSGIADYIGSTRVGWEIFLEEDYRCRLQGIAQWQGHGIIADYDDPASRRVLETVKLPVVAVGGSYLNPDDYPATTPYVATDNYKLVKLAFDHLIEAGLNQFACFSLPEADANRWAQQRELAFASLMRSSGQPLQIYRGVGTSAPDWSGAVSQLIAWLQQLPKPVGIIAVTDARARQLLQACLSADIAVPEQVALIGIDNDPLARILTRIPLSSVVQGAQEIGRAAAHLLHQMLHGANLDGTRILVPPAGLNGQASSRHKSLNDPYVMQAMHFIRQYACQGIKTDQVADYLGVSRSTLAWHFRRCTGRSIHDEILSFKLEAAKAMLRDSQQLRPIAEIAVSCGFTSLQYLHTVFKRELGCTPRSYQQQAMLPDQSPACLMAPDPAGSVSAVTERLPVTRLLSRLSSQPLHS